MKKKIKKIKRMNGFTKEASKREVEDALATNINIYGGVAIENKINELVKAVNKLNEL